MLQEGDSLFDLASLGPTVEGTFLERPNRFVAIAEVKGEKRRVHVADTGRLEEILTPARALLLLKNREGMSTDYTLLAARMEEGWVLINTRLHAPIAKKAIERGVLGFVPKRLRSEVRFGHSRFDYRADDAFVELKGCSLVQQNECRFPNAPTIRGVRHLLELLQAKEQGFRAFILIMALRPCDCFRAHPRRDENFRRTFYTVLKKGVQYKGFHIRIVNDTVVYAGVLKLCQDKKAVSDN
ncbi:DNA/RNA nuclease SfsA [Hydrogenimonas urashimensis]|uniref:DNA/RNA nuclease SfsA n=1 Tax=Hydrogenimonas urashimensis TaxID=2740515 RepID=UPI0019155822|nr:DNA/RNA nuclease SfsA [Hydrogenimonas urashimensis]